MVVVHHGYLGVTVVVVVVGVMEVAAHAARELGWRRRWGRPGGLVRQGHRRRCRGRLVPGALLVRAQPGQLGVGALAHVALVGTLTRVQAHVVAQRGRLAEAAVAEAADEGLVKRVDAHVGAQVATRVEAPVADHAAHATTAG